MVDRLPKGWKSYLFVLIQFACLGLIGLSGPLFPSSAIWLAVELAGLALGIWAVMVMGIGHFHIAPDPLKWTRLVASGPYRYIRHPMYLAVLMATLPLAVDRCSPLQVSIWLALVIDLILKIAYEESLLLDRVEGYESYRRRSFRLIPLIY